MERGFIMELISVSDYLKDNTYPGRGIIIGKSSCGKYAVTAYFIMGRSENSRNRIFVKDGDGIRTQAFDESKLSDPSLIIYSPVRVLDNKIIVTNGDQTDTIYNMMSKKFTFEQALRTREFEPDAPNYTPRISGIIKFRDNNFHYFLSILKSADGDPQVCERFTYGYNSPVNGVGHFIHTYKCDGNPIPSFKGEPKRIAITESIDKFTNTLWSSLNEENKVSLFVRYVDLMTKEVKTNIVNKNK